MNAVDLRVAERIRAKMSARSWGTWDLSEETGIGGGVLVNGLDCTESFRVSDLYVIAHALGCSVIDLLP